MNDKLKELFEGMELSDEFQDKIAGIFEKELEEIKEKAEQDAEAKYEAISEEYSEYLVSEMEEKTEQYIQDEIIPVVERYIDYATEEYIKENKLVIESETKVELADKFLSGFSAIAEQYNVEVPEGQDDVVAGLKNQLKEAQERVDTLIQDKQSLEESIVAGKKAAIIEDVSDQLTETQKERFAKVAEEVKYHSDEQYKEALKELKESYHPAQKEEEETLVTEQEEDEASKSGSNDYLTQVFSRI